MIVIHFDVAKLAALAIAIGAVAWLAASDKREK